MNKQKTPVCTLLFAAVLTMISCSNGTNDVASIKIGTQTWAKKNLDVATFRNGDPIPEAKTDEEWVKAGKEHKPAWCYYNDKQTLGEYYGRLYNWYAVSDTRGLAPDGWHVPGDAEWTTLTDFLGSEAIYMIKYTSGWDKKRNGNNKSGFKALPGGFRNNDGTFSSFGSYSSWWSSTEYSDSSALIRYIGSTETRVLGGDANKPGGYSVRCLVDSEKKENKNIYTVQMALDSIPQEYLPGLNKTEVAAGQRPNGGKITIEKNGSKWMKIFLPGEGDLSIYQLALWEDKEGNPVLGIIRAYGEGVFDYKDVMTRSIVFYKKAAAGWVDVTNEIIDPVLLKPDVLRLVFEPGDEVKVIINGQTFLWNGQKFIADSSNIVSAEFIPDTRFRHLVISAPSL